MKRPNLFLPLCVVAALVFNTDLSAQRRGGGNYGGGNRNVRSANSSVNRNYNQNTNVNRNVNVNQNVNVNRNVNVNVNNSYHGSYYGGGYYGGGCCYHPVATAAAVTAAVVGSIVDRPPAGYVTTIVNGLAYQQCGNTWYQPQMYGTTTNYVVVTPPRWLAAV
jgi:hypothetical protein